MPRPSKLAASLTASTLLLGVLLPAPAHADDAWVLGPVTELLPTDPSADDRSGEVVATDGDLVVSGAPRHDHNGFVDHGAVYVHRRTGAGLVLEAELLPNVAKNNQSFGSAVDVDGDTIVVGARHDDDLCPSSNFCDSGAVYVFVHDGTSWSLQAKLTPGDLESADLFGSAVRIQGDTLVAGSPGDRDAGSATGAAYVFTRSGTTWTETQKLLASDLSDRSRFAAGLALHGELLVVGAPEDDDGGSWTEDYGAAYVFRSITGVWQQEAKLRASDAFVGMEAGASVGAGADVVLLGAPGANAPLTGSGAAYVFEKVGSSWLETTKLTDPAAGQGDRFGTACSLFGDALVIGSAPEISGAGSVSAYRRTGAGWERFTQFAAPDAAPFDRFGVAVRLSQDTLVVGASGHTHAGGVVDAGVAYAYELLPLFTAYCDASPNSSGLPARLQGAGSSSVSANDLVLETTGMPPSVPALLLYGAGQTQVPFGGGSLCVSGPLFRLQPPGASDASGAFSRAVDYGTLSAAGAITAGSTWNFQCWFRDVNPSGFHLSNGLAVVFVH